MKKFLIVCILIFTASMGCKKMDIDGGGLCACSPITGPQVFLVVKNNAGEDLLNEKTTGAYSKEKIQLFRKDENEKVIPINFSIRPPFSYGNEKFDFNQLHLGDLYFLKASSDNIFYVKLGDGALHELNFVLTKEGEQKLFINKKEAEREKGTIGKSLPIFYLTEVQD